MASQGQHSDDAYVATSSQRSHAKDQLPPTFSTRLTRSNKRKLEELENEDSTEQPAITTASTTAPLAQGEDHTKSHTIQSKKTKKASATKSGARTRTLDPVALPKLTIKVKAEHTKRRAKGLSDLFAPRASLSWNPSPSTVKEVRTANPGPITPKKSTKKALATPFKLPTPLTTPVTEPILKVDPHLMQLMQLLIHREPLGSKPAPQGQPAVWAAARQEMCETLPYYKSHYGGCYANDGVAYSFMLDGVSSVREYMDEDVVICRAGGNMISDGKGKMAQGKDHSIHDSQPQAVLNNIKHQNPIVIICGDKNEASPTEMPHKFCVLGWFKPTHVWAEKIIGAKGLVRTSLKYRFERLDRSKPAWYARQTPAVSQEQRQSIPKHESRQCQVCSMESPVAMLSGWMCLNADCVQFWRPKSGRMAPCNTMQYHPAFLTHYTIWPRQDEPFNYNPGVPDTGKHIGDNLQYINTRGVVCPKCGRCNVRYLFRGWVCDTKDCDWLLTPEHQVVSPRSLHFNPWDIVSDGPALTKSTSKSVVRVQIQHTHNYKVARYSIPGIEGCIVHAKANRTIAGEPQGPDAMFETLQLEDIGLVRRTFGVEAIAKVEEPISKQADHMSKAAEVGMVDKSTQVNFGDPTSLSAQGENQPDYERFPVDTAVDEQTRHREEAFKFRLSFTETTSTADAAALPKVLTEPPSSDEATSGRPTVQPISDEQATQNTGLLSPVSTPQKTARDARVSNSELISSANPQDQIAEEREANLDEANKGRMQSFSMNFGYPYKFVAGGDSQSFESSAWPIRACRSRLNWALRALLGEPKIEQFNELLAIGYMERQKIGYHDDGEAGLGPVIATLSLGAAAKMSLRLKSKYYSGTSKQGLFTFEQPLPLEVLQRSASTAATTISQEQWDARNVAYKELQDIKTGKQANFQQRSRELSKELGLKQGAAQPLVELHLTHGDIVIMQGEAIQKYFEHAVEPQGSLRFALTCRQILPHHLTADQKPAYEVRPDDFGYDGSQIRRAGDPDLLQW